MTYATGCTSATVNAWRSALDQPLLSPERELLLARRTKRGDEAAANELFERNLRLVVHLYRQRYERAADNAGIDGEAILQEGAIGLQHAITKYDPERGFRFTTYATHWVLQKMKRAMTTLAPGAHVPINVRDAVVTAQRKDSDLSAAAIAAAAGLDEQTVIDAMNAMKPLSLDRPVKEDSSTTIYELLALDGDEVDELEDLADHDQHRHEASKLLQLLPAREARLIALRFGIGTSHPHTIVEAADELGVTLDRARQLEQRAMSALQQRANTQERLAAGVRPTRRRAERDVAANPTTTPAQ